jgi:hypothetical protein
MGKFDDICKNLNEESDPDYLDWDDSYHDWQLTIINEKDFHGDNFVNKVDVKNTTQGLTVYNLLAKANGWPKLWPKRKCNVRLGSMTPFLGMNFLVEGSTSEYILKGNRNNGQI